MVVFASSGHELDDGEMGNEGPTSWISELRLRLGNPSASRLPASDLRQAAVLVPLYVDAGELWTLLTKRSTVLPNHRGQIAFPGGSLESGESSWDGALREAREEIGLESKRVLRIGELDEAKTPSGFRIVPCVGAVPLPLEVDESSEEIDEVFSVPLRAFIDARVIEDRLVELDGEQLLIRIFHVGGRRVWGLTARIVQNLLERLGLAVPMPVQ